MLKELIGKMTLKSSNFPRKITVNKVGLFDQKKIAHEFNSFFTNIGKKLASKIPNASTPFKSFVNKSELSKTFIVETKPVSMNELKDAFHSLKSSKSPVYDDIIYNVIKNCFRSFSDEPLKYFFNLSIEKGVSPNNLKIAQVTIEELFSRFVGSDAENQAILFEEINKELEAFITKESNNKDATYGVLDLLTIISDSFQKKFDELIRINSDKKEVCQGTVKNIRAASEDKDQHNRKN